MFYLYQLIDSTKIELDIFSTSEVSRKLKKTLSNSKQCNVHNPISNNELTEVLKRYDVLLFVEALKGRYKNAARLSFSTKFADYLKLSRCILAIGSKNIAPIEYLEEHNAACIITDEKQIYDTLLTLISNKNLLNDYALASYQTGFYNHNKERVQMELYNQFDSFL
ncbi:MAG: hypothetical protein KMY54_06680 [Erysipelothrix sp.]|nr:hypothetical protein [Erysipelothrix sp.]